MRGTLGQNRIGVGATIWSPGDTEDSAATTLMVVRYPAAKDTPPTLVNDTTPASGIFLNYLGMMLEAIMAEIGPMKDVVAKHQNLLRFLGSEWSKRFSCWRSIAKKHGGDQAGQLFGVTKYRITDTPANLNTVVRRTTCFMHQSHHPKVNKRPAVFAVPNSVIYAGTQSDGFQVCTAKAGVTGLFGNTFFGNVQFDYRGGGATATGQGAGAVNHHIDFLFFYMVESL